MACAYNPRTLGTEAESCDSLVYVTWGQGHFRKKEEEEEREEEGELRDVWIGASTLH